MTKFLVSFSMVLASGSVWAIGSNEVIPLGDRPSINSISTELMLAAVAPSKVFLGRASDEDEENLLAQKPMELLTGALQKIYPKDRIEIHTLTWMTGTSPRDIESIRIIEDRPGGEIRFEAIGVYQGIRGSIQGLARFSVYRKVPVAMSRVTPGERLQAAAFKLSEIDVASGINREYQGLILSSLEEISNKEARQTILEGNYVLSTSVQKIPDVRRGDTVSVKLISGGVVLVAPAVAQENGFLDQSVKVLTSKTKRELQGKVALNGVVEVKL